MNYDDYKDDIRMLVELRGVYDGWSIAVLKDGTRVNRWANQEGYERRAEIVEAYLRGEESNGRWF